MSNVLPNHVPDLWSLADLSRHFALPESTIRYYCKRFAPFFSVQGMGRRRRYTAQACDVIGAIVAHMPYARTAARVERHLRSNFVASKSASSGEMPSTLPCVEDQNTMETLAQQLGRALTQLADLVKDNILLREEIRTLRLLQHTAEQTMQDDISQIRAWVGRLVQARSSHTVGV